MFDQDVAAAFRAVSAFADVAALEPAKELFALGDADIFFLPKCERAHRRGGIMPAVFAMTVTHLQRITAHLDLHRSAVTCSFMFLGHGCLMMAQTRGRLQPCRRYRALCREESLVLKLVRPNLDKFARRRRPLFG